MATEHPDFIHSYPKAAVTLVAGMRFQRGEAGGDPDVGFLNFARVKKRNS